MNKNLFLIERIVLLFFPRKNKKEMDHREYCYTEIGSIISITNQVFQEWPRSPSWANSVARLKSRLPGLIG